jgi:hypothetical protein
MKGGNVSFGITITGDDNGIGRKSINFDGHKKQFESRGDIIIVIVSTL